MIPTEAFASKLDELVKKASCSRQHTLPYYALRICGSHLRELLTTACIWQREQDARIVESPLKVTPKMGGMIHIQKELAKLLRREPP